MRVTLVGPVYPHRGGIAQHTACLARALEEDGCEVQVIGFSRLYPRLGFPGTTELDTSARPIEFPSERILTAWSPASWLRATAAIARFDPDLVVVAWWHSLFLPMTTFALGWQRLLAHRRTVLLSHNVTDHDHAVLDALAGPLLARLPNAHLVHAASAAARIRARHANARVMVVPHPSYDVFRAFADDVTKHDARAALGLNQDELVLLFFGLVRPYKGLDVALEALAELVAEVRNGGRARDARLRFVIAGESYGPAGDVRRLVDKLGLGDHVVLHDHFIPNEHVARYFRAADVLVAPYRHASHSGVTQIARAFHVPTIATDVGGLSELVRHDVTGLLVPAPPDAHAFAHAIARCRDEPSLLPRLRDALREEERTGDASAFTWQALARALRELTTSTR